MPGNTPFSLGRFQGIATKSPLKRLSLLDFNLDITPLLSDSKAVNLCLNSLLSLVKDKAIDKYVSESSA